MIPYQENLHKRETLKSHGNQQLQRDDIKNQSRVKQTIKHDVRHRAVGRCRGLKMLDEIASAFSEDVEVFLHILIFNTAEILTEMHIK